ncbi:MAG: NADPH-dependent FMN reductase [Flavobacteriaceae bacterium]
MKKIVAFGASNSYKSINKALAKYTADQLPEVEVDLLDLNDFEFPIYHPDLAKFHGVPQAAKDFKLHLNQADGLIISFAEYNGSYTAIFKNIFDWISVIEKNIWHDKPMFLLATSPGARGAIQVLEMAHLRISRANTNRVEKFSLPSFKDNFDPEKGILNPELNAEFQKCLTRFQTALKG